MIKQIIIVSSTILVGLSALYFGLKLEYTMAPTNPIVWSKESNTLRLKGMVYDLRMGPTLRPHTDMHSLSKKLTTWVREGKKHIYINIDSPGGFMHAGMAFVWTMRDAQYHGVKFTCVVDGVAMSMALIIFSQCDERYATFGSAIMWHSIAMGSPKFLNEQKASELLDFFVIRNEKVWASTRIHFLPWYFVEHFKNETILSATEVERNSFRYLRIIREHRIQ